MYGYWIPLIPYFTGFENISMPKQTADFKASFLMLKKIGFFIHISTKILQLCQLWQNWAANPHFVNENDLSTN